MKPRFFSLLLASATVALSIFSPSAQANEQRRFFCGRYKDQPITVAQTKRGHVPVILWRSEAFSQSGFTPQKRCKIVSDKFEAFNRSNKLQYLTTGRVNGYNVLCAVPTKTSCQASDILFTLESTDNPEQILTSLLAVRDGASGPLVRGSIWINMNEFLRYAPTTNTSIPSSSQPDSSFSSLW